MTLGSSAGITACAVAAAGTPVRLKAVRGEDEFGAACHRWLTERGVDAGPVRIDPTVRTGSSVILVRADDPGDREILTDLGAMTALTVADLDDQLLTSAGHVYVSSFFLHAGARDDLHTRLRRARELGCTVSLDTNDDPDRLWGSGAREAIGESDVLFVNESEARGLAGADASEPLAVVVMELLALMPRQGRDPRLPAVVLKLGVASRFRCKRAGPGSGFVGLMLRGGGDSVGLVGVSGS
ncbi:carbohydrate kinase family protein [Nostocoides vanveenii]|uniref:carbohydrate kinase family protein n=1 Tax=Nostocoides vanveenii TaxID=330835 RepID=UPI003CD0B281